MSKIENPPIEPHETSETSESKVESDVDMNDRVDATGEDTGDDWEGEIGDLPDEPYQPAGKEVTMSYAHLNVSRTELPNAPDVKTDFNNAAEDQDIIIEFHEETGDAQSDLEPPPGFEL
jgi:hypothetical protein